MPRKSTAASDIPLEAEETMEDSKTTETNKGKSETEIEKLNRMLAAVLNYLSDDEVEEIDIEFLLSNTDGLREWWDKYRERNKKQIEEEIKQSLGDLTLEELKRLREQIKESKLDGESL